MLTEEQLLLVRGDPVTFRDEGGKAYRGTVVEVDVWDKMEVVFWADGLGLVRALIEEVVPGTDIKPRRSAPRRRNTSRYLGVCSRGKGWRAQIRVNGTQIHLGSFSDETEAAWAYIGAVRKFRGVKLELDDLLRSQG